MDVVTSSSALLFSPWGLPLVVKEVDVGLTLVPAPSRHGLRVAGVVVVTWEVLVSVHLFVMLVGPVARTLVRAASAVVFPPTAAAWVAPVVVLMVDTSLPSVLHLLLGAEADLRRLSLPAAF